MMSHWPSDLACFHGSSKQRLQRQEGDEQMEINDLWQTNSWEKLPWDSQVKLCVRSDDVNFPHTLVDISSWALSFARFLSDIPVLLMALGEIWCVSTEADGLRDCWQRSCVVRVSEALWSECQGRFMPLTLCLYVRMRNNVKHRAVEDEATGLLVYLKSTQCIWCSGPHDVERHESMSFSRSPSARVPPLQGLCDVIDR